MASLPYRAWIVHDWLTGMRGGEKVLLELVRLLPNARIATLLHVPGATHPEIEARVARTSFLQHLPGAARHYRSYLPLFPRAVRSLRLDGPCDLVISSSHAVAKGIRIPTIENQKSKIKNPVHLCYCHTPMRYIWGMEEQYGPRWHTRLALRLVRGYLRRFDLRSNAGVTRFVANSRHVAARIKTLYGRDAEVVHPGVDTEYFTPLPGAERDTYLIVSALVGYKRIDLAIRAFAATPGRKLRIIGRGPEEGRLRRLAEGAENITFAGAVSDDELRAAYQHCRALVFPGEEDFGLTPLEAQACGRPVIAYAKGGVLETVTESTGIFFGQATPESLRAAVAEFERRGDGAFVPEQIRKHALAFAWAGFHARMTHCIEELLA